jgi:hypothetical protein
MGVPIGLQLRVSNEALLKARVVRAKETNGPPFPFYSGRGAKLAGLVSDRTRTFSSLEFFPSFLEFIPNSPFLYPLINPIISLYPTNCYCS